MSNVTPKTDSEIEGMREAGRLAAEVLELISPQVEVGMTTGELDRICHDHIVNVQKAIPAPLNYKGFPMLFVLELICGCSRVWAWCPAGTLCSLGNPGAISVSKRRPEPF